MSKLITGDCKFIKVNSRSMGIYTITDINESKLNSIEDFLRTLNIFNSENSKLPFQIIIERYGIPLINENGEIKIMVEFPKNKITNDLKYSYEQEY